MSNILKICLMARNLRSALIFRRHDGVHIWHNRGLWCVDDNKITAQTLESNTKVNCPLNLCYGS